MTFKVGDRVIDGKENTGTVVEISDDTRYPVWVKFDNSDFGKVRHSLDGRLFSTFGDDTDNIRKLTPLEKALK